MQALIQHVWEQLRTSCQVRERLWCWNKQLAEMQCTILLFTRVAGVWGHVGSPGMLPRIGHMEVGQSQGTPCKMQPHYRRQARLDKLL